MTRNQALLLGQITLTAFVWAGALLTGSNVLFLLAGWLSATTLRVIMQAAGEK